MHIVIMGCGRVGSTLAHILEDRGNSVAMIDQDPEAFRRLRSAFKGERITGIGFDRDPLIAGRHRAGRRLRGGEQRRQLEHHRGPGGPGDLRRGERRARIYDPRRAEVYERLGIPTVATVRWTADQMLRKLLPEGAEEHWRDPSGSGRARRGRRDPAAGSASR